MDTASLILGAAIGAGLVACGERVVRYVQTVRGRRRRMREAANIQRDGVMRARPVKQYDQAKEHGRARVDVYYPKEVIMQIDRRAQEQGSNRSDYLNVLACTHVYGFPPSIIMAAKKEITTLMNDEVVN